MAGQHVIGRRADVVATAHGRRARDADDGQGQSLVGVGHLMASPLPCRSVCRPLPSSGPATLSLALGTVLAGGITHLQAFTAPGCSQRRRTFSRTPARPGRSSLTSDGTPASLTARCTESPTTCPSASTCSTSRACPRLRHGRKLCAVRDRGGVRLGRRFSRRGHDVGAARDDAGQRRARAGHQVHPDAVQGRAQTVLLPPTRPRDRPGRGS